MANKFNLAETALLCAAVEREERYLTLPISGKAAQARKTADKLIEAGLVREVKATGEASVLRRDAETGSNYALKLTAAGVKAAMVAAVSESVIADPAQSEGEVQKARTESPMREWAADNVRDLDGRRETPGNAVAPRAGTEIAEVIEMLGRAEGVTIDELVARMGWLPHSTRAALTGLRKRGYELTADRSDRARGSIYRISDAPPSDAEAGPDLHGASAVDPKAPADPAPAARRKRRSAAAAADAVQSQEAP
jgi:hypothetical protein